MHPQQPLQALKFQQMPLLLFLFRFTMQAVIVNKTAHDLEEQRRYYFTLPAFDLLQPIQSLRWKWYCLFRKKSGFLRK